MNKISIMGRWLVVLLQLVLACTAPNATERNVIDDLKQKLPALEPGRALMKIRVGGEDFYPQSLPFKTKVQLVPQSFKVSFIDSTYSNVEMEMIKEKWIEQKPIAFAMNSGPAGESGGDQMTVMIGKLLDQVNLQGEGYLMVNGKIEVPELNRNLITIVFEGNLIKPGQADVAENYVPVQGTILIKEPAFTGESSAEIVKRIK